MDGWRNGVVDGLSTDDVSVVKRRSVLKFALAAGVSSLGGVLGATGGLASKAAASPVIASSIVAGVTIGSGFATVAGCVYQPSSDKLFITDGGSGQIRSFLVHTHVAAVIGSGYTYPDGIALSADGAHLYVGEQGGDLLRAPIASANRASAATIVSGLGRFEQIALDEPRNCAYVAEYTGANRLLRIDLATGALTTVGTAAANVRGVLVTNDGRFVYTSDDGGSIRRYDLNTNTRTVVASGLNGPRHLSWADAGQSVILVPQPNPSPRVLKVDLSTAPATVTAIAFSSVPAPYSVAVTSPERMLIVGGTGVSEVDFTNGVFTSAGPILLGIGFVPADAAHLPGGYADTTSDPAYFYQVKDCPFGATLPLMINHDNARGHSCTHYKVTVTPLGGSEIEIHQPFTDLRWSPSLNEFEQVTTVPVNGFYPVRQAGEIWLNYWLGLLMDTTGLPNGANTIRVKLFTAPNPGAEFGNETQAGRFATVMIDNTAPTARINAIWHDGAPVDTCAIVSTGSHNFSFDITASAPRHLGGWELVAYWGDNQSKVIASDSYAAHISPSRQWMGLSHVQVPPPGPTPWNAQVVGDGSSIHCAHTFSLSAWDRVINGWNYVHGGAGYNKSITLFF